MSADGGVCAGAVWGAVWPCGDEASSRAAAADAAVIMAASVGPQLMNGKALSA